MTLPSAKSAKLGGQEVKFEILIDGWFLCHWAVPGLNPLERPNFIMVSELGN